MPYGIASSALQLLLGVIPLDLAEMFSVQIKAQEGCMFDQEETWGYIPLECHCMMI